MLGLFYPYGFILQAIAIVHFVRRRPETFWLWIILLGGGLGALVYIAVEVIPDATLLRGAFEVFPRRKRIKQLHAAIVDNPAIGNYEELGDLYLEDRQYARARECFDRVIAARTDSTDAFYRRALAAGWSAPPSARSQRSVQNVLLVTMDGLRWQEVFGGLSPDLLTPEAGGVDEDVAAAFRARFGGATPEARRETLMPFFWTVVAKQGQVFGDASRGSEARLTNGLRFSYPGYNEILTGYPDPRIDSNDRIANPNVTILEWLNRRSPFAGRVAAFASWELLPWIVNTERSGVLANGEGAPIADPASERERAINEFAADLPPYWGATRHDAPTGFGALEYLRKHRPRVLYVMLGETDEWAHGRRYDLYLDAAWRNDRFVRRLWESAQSMPEYANRTALVLTTDHGRGDTAKTWTSHGRDVPAAERIWIAVLAPGVPPLGVRSQAPATQSQVAATVAALLGEDYAATEPKAAPPLDLHR